MMLCMLGDMKKAIKTVSTIFVPIIILNYLKGLESSPNSMNCQKVLYSET